MFSQNSTNLKCEAYYLLMSNFLMGEVFNESGSLFFCVCVTFERGKTNYSYDTMIHFAKPKLFLNYHISSPKRDLEQLGILVH